MPISLMLNLFHVHLKWSKRIIRSQTNIEKKEVLNVLIAMKNFYSKISVIKPDLSHPDIIKCFNLSAKESNIKQIKIKFKDSIEINSFDPFNNVMGKDAKNIEQKYYHEKKVALKKHRQDKRSKRISHPASKNWCAFWFCLKFLGV